MMKFLELKDLNYIRLKGYLKQDLILEHGKLNILSSGLVILISLIVGLEMSNEYFVDLVSNASMNVFPDNVISKFINRLPYPLRLDGEWMVAVQEIFYPTAHKPLKLKIEWSMVYRKKWRSSRLFFIYDEGEKIEDIIDRLNLHMKEAYNEDFKVNNLGNVLDQKIHFAPKFEIRHVDEKDKDGKEIVKKKVVLHAGFIPDSPKPFIPSFYDHAFWRLLGFDLSELVKGRNEIHFARSTQIKASNQPETAPTSHLMFIYSDIIDEHFVGDVSARVLRVVPLDKQSKNSLAHITFNNPYYYPVRSNNIEDISILLNDETGHQIRFKSGRVYLSLHFKRKTVV